MRELERLNSADEILAAIIRVGSTGTSNGKFSRDDRESPGNQHREHFRL